VTPPAVERWWVDAIRAAFVGLHEGVSRSSHLNRGSSHALEPESTTHELPVEEIAFTPHNDPAEALDWNPCKWKLYTGTDGDWKFVAPDAYAMPASSLSPGDSQTLTLHVGDRPDQGCTKYVQDLSASVYAFCAFGSTDGHDGAETAYAALFEVEAESA
jgi:hypothetical protein